MTKKNTLTKEQEKRFYEIEREFYDRFPCLIKPVGYMFTKDGKKFEVEASAEVRDEVWRFLANELAEQKKEIIEKLEKMKMPISQADKDLAKGTEESGIFRVFLNEAINQAIKTLKKVVYLESF